MDLELVDVVELEDGGGAGIRGTSCAGFCKASSVTVVSLRIFLLLMTLATLLELLSLALLPVGCSANADLCLHCLPIAIRPSGYSSFLAMLS